ncbi:MAG TPA: hypothetical protein VFS39_06300 [Nitrospira sp.]|nr:hypothetical protein [Nitrospira sp.]
MNAFIEHQREQIERLEGQLQAQRATVDQLKSQLDRQTATATDLQQRLAQRALPAPPNPYLYSYVYPPVGLGIYLGRPWIYGPPFFYHPYWGPRFYGHWRRGW